MGFPVAIPDKSWSIQLVTNQLLLASKAPLLVGRLKVRFSHFNEIALAKNLPFEYLRRVTSASARLVEFMSTYTSEFKTMFKYW